jgi:hypothetical protein
MAKKSDKPDPQQRGTDSSETQIGVRLARPDTVIFDVKTPNAAEVDELVEKVLDVRRELVMQNE